MKRVSSEKYISGKYRGIVEYNKDPMRLGRCKVRVPDIHGVSSPSLIELLPWSRPIQSNVCGEDSGTFIVPEVGSWVWVEFEGDDKNHPLYSGGFHGVVRTENEVPLESLEGMQEEISPVGTKIYRPTSWTLFKSSRGTTIGGQEEEGSESFWIIDRVGQVFKTVMPMKKGTGKRKKRNMLRDEKYDYDQTLTGKVVTIFKAFGGGFLQVVSEKFKETISIVSKDRSGRKNAELSLRSHSSNVESIVLAHDSDTGNVVYLKANASLGTIDIVVRRGGVDTSLISIGDHISIKPELRVPNIEVTTLNVNALVANTVSTPDLRASSIQGSLSGSYSEGSTPSISPTPIKEPSDGIDRESTVDTEDVSI